MNSTGKYVVMYFISNDAFIRTDELLIFCGPFIGLMRILFLYLSPAFLKLRKNFALYIRLCVFNVVIPYRG